MEKLKSPYTPNTLGLSSDVFTKRKLESLWEKVDEIIDWINKMEKDMKVIPQSVDSRGRPYRKFTETDFYKKEMAEKQNEVDYQDAINKLVTSIFGRNVEIIMHGEAITLEKKIKPEPVEEPDLTKLKEMTSKFIESVLNGTSTDRDCDLDNQYHIFVAALEAIYGHDIFTWVSDKEQED